MGRSDQFALAVTGAVLCGGQSRRFGSDKALADAGGLALGRRVIDALRDGGADPVLAVGGGAGTQLGVPTVADRHPGLGPLAALATVLAWARDGLVVVAPCDLPLLSGDHVAALIAAAGPDQAAVATVGTQTHPSLACWPARWAPAVAARVDAGDRAWRTALECGPWVPVSLPADALADADTPEQLRRLVPAPGVARTVPA